MDNETTCRTTVPDQHSSIQDALHSIYHRWVIREADAVPRGLFAFLKAKLPHLDPTSWEERAALGGICVNGKIQKGDLEIPLPSYIEYFEPKFSPQNPSEAFPPFSPDWILHQDEYLIVLFKPAGLPTLPNRDQQSFCLKNYLEEYLSCKIHLPSRLDTSTSGVVVASLHPTTHSSIQKLFERRLIDKYYLLELSTRIPWTRKTIDLPIGRDPTHPVLRRIDMASGQPAETHFVRIDHDRALLFAKPLSGRTHQIRVHACTAAGPLIGDRFYQGAPSPTLHLMSHSIALVHPETKTRVAFTVPPRLLPEWVPGELPDPESLF